MPEAKNVIRMVCPNLSCRSVLSVPEQARGMLLRCGRCGATVKVPKQPPAPPSDAPA